MLVSTTAFAQDEPLGSLSIKGGVVNCSGGSGTLDIYWTTTNDKIGMLDFQIVVPTGLKLSTTASAIKGCAGVQTITPGDWGSYYSYTLESSGVGAYITGTDGKLISIPFTYDDTFVGGDAVIREIAVSSDWTGEPAEGDHADEYYNDVEFTFELGAAVETVSITLDHEYITYCSDKTLDFSAVEGLTASYVSAVTSTEAELTGVVGAVASGQGIILQGEAGTTYEVPVVEEGEDLAGNILIGVLEATPIDAGNYILMDGEFIPCTDGTLPAGKAYLPKDAVTSGAKVISLVFGESTGINEVQKSEFDGAIYNLSGMRVSKTQKGVYIMNGRKVIVK